MNYLAAMTCVSLDQWDSSIKKTVVISRLLQIRRAAIEGTVRNVQNILPASAFRNQGN